MGAFIETKEQLEAKLAMLRAERKAELANIKIIIVLWKISPAS